MQSATRILPILVALLLSNAGRAGEPVETQQLRLMKESLESCIVRFKTLTMHYAEIRQQVAWEDENSALRERLLEGWRNREPDRRNRESADAGQLPPLERPAYEADPISEKSNCVLYYDYPSIRLDKTTMLGFDDGRTEEHKIDQIFHQGKYSEIKHSYKRMLQGSSGGYSSFAILPTVPLGLQLPNDPDRSLVDLLDFPGVTTVEGLSEIDGHGVVELKVGPGIPRGESLAGLSEQSWVRLRLAPDLFHLPLEVEYHYVTEVVAPDGKIANVLEFSHKTSIADFINIADDAAKGSCRLPTSISYTDVVTRTEWQVVDASLNKPLGDRIFRVSAPPGYLVSRDGAAPEIRLSGGPEQRRAAIDDTVRMASEMMESQPPPRNRPWLLSPRFLAPVVALTVLFALTLLRRLNNAA